MHVKRDDGVEAHLALLIACCIASCNENYSNMSVEVRPKKGKLKPNVGWSPVWTNELYSS